MNSAFNENGIHLENCDNLIGMKQFADGYFDLALIDAPYRNINENAPFQQMRLASGGGKIEMFKNGKPPAEFWEEVKRVSKEQIIFGANNYGFAFKGFIAWDKCVRGSDRYSQVEIASLSEGLSTTSTLVQISTYVPNKVHPTEKPAELYSWILHRFAKEGWKILDTHVGSGSSLCACYDNNFEAWGFEIDEKYYSRAVERLNDEMAQIRLDI